MRANRAELRVPLATAKLARLPERRRERDDFTRLADRKPEKLSPWVCLQLIVATSLVLWIAAVEATGMIR